MRAAVVLMFVVGCVQSEVTVCPNGDLCTGGTTCVTTEDATLCVTPEQIAACDELPNLATCGSGRRCYEVTEGLVCLDEGCGNGFVDPDEQCDDRNNDSDDGCSGDCRSNERCGNGVVDVYREELCDDGGFVSHDGCSSACTLEAPRWIEHSPTNTRGGEVVRNGFAFDTRRGELVVFGGTNVLGMTFSKQTYVWRNGWIHAQVTAGPVPRAEPATAYDERRGLTVMFGGMGQEGLLADTWVWNGTTWRALEAFGPIPREMAALTYDPIGDRLVMFGGVRKGQALAETWQLKGETWTQIAMTGGPVAQQTSTLAFDRSTSKVVLVTGDEHWELDGTTWTRIGSAPCADAIGGCSVVYEGGSSRLLLFGRAAANQPTLSVWAWTGQWSVVGATTAQIRGRLVAADTVHGGVLAKRGDEILRWDGTDFVVQPDNPSGDPDSMIGVAAVNDPLRRRVITFGGNATNRLSPSPKNDTWAFDGVRWDLLAPGQRPSARWDHAMAYDSARDRIVMFGGATLTGVLADTWIWDGATWTPGPSGPPARSGHAMVYDAVRDRVVLFGGVNATHSSFEDTWEWDGAAWTQNTSGPHPSARTNPGLAFDPIRGEVILFGGGTWTIAATTEYLTGIGETWKLDATGWTHLEPVVGPSARGRTSLTWNNVRSRLLLVAGESAQMNLNGMGRAFKTDAWEWDGVVWRQVTDELDERGWHAAVRTPDGSGVRILGGQNSLETRIDSGELRWDGQVPYETCTTRVDGDGDGLAACADPDCDPRCHPTCTLGVPCDPQAVRCGDGTCSSIEDAYVCPEDCGAATPVCGDLVCDGTEVCAGDC